MPRLPINYQNTIIYKIVCKDLLVTECYVGHTTEFIKRKWNHKSRCNNINDKKHNLYIYTFIRENGGWDNWVMIEIEKYSCLDVNEACKRERYYIELLKAELNKVIPTRTKKEYNNENIEFSKEYQKEYQTEYYKQHKDHLLKKYQQNKDEISRKNRERYALKKANANKET
jgi:hypothetical protein